MKSEETTTRFKAQTLSEFELGRRRGIRQAARMVRNHFNDAPMIRGLANELAGLENLPTPMGQSDEEEAEHDRAL